jgi:hypothetical protein
MDYVYIPNWPSLRHYPEPATRVGEASSVATSKRRVTDLQMLARDLHASARPTPGAHTRPTKWRARSTRSAHGRTASTPSLTRSSRKASRSRRGPTPTRSFFVAPKACGGSRAATILVVSWWRSTRTVAQRCAKPSRGVLNRADATSLRSCLYPRLTRNPDSTPIAARCDETTFGPNAWCGSGQELVTQALHLIAAVESQARRAPQRSPTRSARSMEVGSGHDAGAGRVWRSSIP